MKNAACAAYSECGRIVQTHDDAAVLQQGRVVVVRVEVRGMTGACSCVKGRILSLPRKMCRAGRRGVAVRQNLHEHLALADHAHVGAGALLDGLCAAAQILYLGL